MFPELLVRFISRASCCPKLQAGLFVGSFLFVSFQELPAGFMSGAPPSARIGVCTFEVNCKFSRAVSLFTFILAIMMTYRADWALISSTQLSVTSQIFGCPTLAMRFKSRWNIVLYSVPSYVEHCFIFCPFIRRTLFYSLSLRGCRLFHILSLHKWNIVLYSVPSHVEHRFIFCPFIRRTLFCILSLHKWNVVLCSVILCLMFVYVFF